MDNNILNSLKQAIIVQKITADVDVAGHKWSFKSLNEGESVWRDRFINLDSNASFFTSERIATLAISIYAINGVPVEEVFQIPVSYPDYDRKCAAAAALYDLLKESDRDTISALREKYEELIQNKVDELKKNSKISTESLKKETKASE
jgi:hypothetical protein